MKRRRLGQHYLVDEGAVRRLVALARIKPSERILEIGTGKGALTKELVGKGSALVGYELDASNYEETMRALGGGGAELRLGDAFEASLEFDVLVSSLPYSESSTFVQWLSGKRFNRAVVVLQADFVRKLQAPAGDRDYKGISALAQIAFDVEVLGKIDRDSFSPPPRVNSMIVSFASRRQVPRGEAAAIIRLFSLRRRQVGSALSKLGMKQGHSYANRRVFELRPEEVHELCRVPRA